MKKFKLRLKQLYQYILILVCRFIALFYKKKHWVICERGTDARDNGYYFYRFLKEKHPEIEVYYLIDKNSADYDKVKEDAVKYGSFRNYWVVVSAEKLISTHYATMLQCTSSKLFVLSKLYKKFYFLQHGVIKDSLPMLYASQAPMRLFVCGAYPEYKFVLETFGHSENVVKYTGLARYDTLNNDNVKKQILLMPTWRNYIHSEEEFLHSDYYNQYQQLISDSMLIEYLERENVKLVFYPHYEVQKWITLFSSKSDNVIIASFSKYDVQTLLKESALLITDYSSVYFDFAYMKKPVVYFQFDTKDFYRHHYQKGYFDYPTMGFGAICNSIEETISSILDSASNNFVLTDNFSQRVDEFFVLRDKNNCERIYEAIINTK